MNSRLGGGDSSLNAMALDADSGGTAEKMDFLIDGQPLPDELVEESIDADRRARWLKDALAVLNERELRIVRERRLSETLVTLETLATNSAFPRNG